MARTGWLLIGALALAFPASAHSAPHAPAFTPCADAKLTAIGAKCGTYAVFEDRAAQRGRTIPLAFIVLPALGPTPAPDAVVFISGGPGEAGRDFAGAFIDPEAVAFQAFRQGRDVLLLDQRGTGASNGLECESDGPDRTAQSYLGDFLPLDQIRACRAALETHADLRLYTTTLAMADLDELRGALGYPQLDIFAGSHGTRDAIDYMRRYPTRVRVAVLRGVVPPDAYVPQTFGRDAQAALDGVIGDCLAEPACAKAYPGLKRDAKAVFERLAQGPAKARVKNPKGEMEDVLLGRAAAAQGVRYMLYSSDAANHIPLVLAAAAHGDFDPLAQWSIQVRIGFGGEGLYLSETCAQDVAGIAYDTDPSDHSFLGDYRLRQQKAACAIWPKAEIPADFHAPFTGKAPILMISGTRDPATAARYVTPMAARLPNVRHVIIPYAAHGDGGVSDEGCALRLMAEAVRTADVAHLDASCAAGMTRKPFDLPAGKAGT